MTWEQGGTVQSLYEFFPSTFNLRNLLSRASSYFDTTGLLTILIAPIKRLMREVLQKSKTEANTTDTNWEFLIPDEDRMTLAQCIFQLEQARNFTYDRCTLYGLPTDGKKSKCIPISTK
jgi:hypothetical protein